MNKRTLKITTGAMIVAIFGVLLLFNRQMGGLLEGSFTYLFPIPMVAYAARYGGRSSLTVFVCMVFTAFLTSTLTSMFYAISAAFVGMIFGAMMFRKMDPTKTLLVVMFLCVLSNLLNLVLLAGISGYNLDAEVREMQEGMRLAMQKANVALPDAMLGTDFLRRIFLVSIALGGAFQGFLIYEISLLILRRMRIPVQKPKAVSQYYPPKWSGLVAFIAFMGYSYAFAKPGMDPLTQGVLETVGMLGYFYLIVFGVIALSLVIRCYVSGKRGVVLLLSILGMFLMPQGVMILALFYISGGLHPYLLTKLEEMQQHG
ncbi:DUF2232 domain-containing protein [Oribacterium sp. HCP28S3_H8]|uniref:DUF2232 domain-containing protein n=1 Tax=Oribacterium sp. HCP28S3_H8 TaxID=3438945 RepID=UPI003F88D316